LRHHGLETELALGPRRVLPIALLASEHPGLVHGSLDRQMRSETSSDLDARFVLRLGPTPRGLPEAERALLDRLGGDDPVPLDRFVASRREVSALARLAARRAVILAGLTPTDAAHGLGLHAAWDAGAAGKAAALLARRKDSVGRPFASSADGVCRRIVETLTARSADFLLEAAFAEDGFSLPGLARHPLAQAALAGHAGLLRMTLSLGVPVVGLGASASTYYPAIASRLGAEALVPEHAEVANAVGAVVGGVHATHAIRILQPVEGVFRVLGGGDTRDLSGRAEAIALATALASEAARRAAHEAGAATADVSVSVEEKTAEAEGREIFIEALVTARASGRPRMG
jgi:N-methylhydantoinase A/oxoprolinase/acetone carboxylase beta subunit